MTSKKIVIAFVLSAAAVTACGKKGGYKAAQINMMKTEMPAPESVNPPAEESIEAKAEKLLLSDEQLSSSRTSAVADILKSELLGISATLAVSGDKTAVDISILTDKSENCEGHVSHAQLESKHMATMNKINNFGRVTCVDTSCDHLLVIMEARRKVKTEEHANGEIQSGAVAVLMKKDEAGVHKPLTTESKNFMAVNSSQVAVETCQEIAARPSTGDEFAAQREADRIEKLRQEEIANRPKTGDEFALQRLREQQDARLKAIDARIQQIDARFKEIAEQKISSDEPKALATEKDKLIQERDGILNARKVTAPQAPEEHVPVDPTLED